MDLAYSIKEGLSGIGRAKLPAAVTVAVGFFSLVLLGLFSTVSLSFFDLIQEVRSRVQLEVFFSDSMSEEQAVVLVNRIKQLRGIREATYVSKEDAAGRFTKEFGEDVIKILGTNPLPRSVTLRLAPGYSLPDSLDHLTGRIQELDYGLDIRYNQQFLSALEQNARLFTWLTMGFGLVISVATVVMTGYTIRLAMYARREKIRTMSLVGATRWFISLPFLIEGAVQGLVSGGLAAFAVYLLFEQVLHRYEPSIHQILQPSALLVYPALVLFGLLLGVFGSALSVSRFLRAS
jgi:cell division transport system permease protein